MTDPVLSLSAAVLALAAVHALGLGVVLLRSDRAPAAARRALAVLALVIAVLLGNMACVFSGVRWGGHAVASSLWLAVGPLFYGYVRGLLPGRARWEPEDLLHALPLALQWTMLAAFAVAPAADPETVAVGGPMFGFTFVMLYGLQTLAYAGMTGRLVQQAAARYRAETAGAEAETFAEMHRLAVVFGVYAAALTVNIGVLLATGAFIDWLDYLVPLALAGLVSVIGYGLLRHPARLLPELVLPARAASTSTPTPDLARHAEALRRLMATDRPYLDPGVRLADLAQRLAVSERTLSQVLADALGGSFYDVVNGYRVAEAQRRLADPTLGHLTVLAVGMDAGFSSKASFNRVFKARTGETPSAYRRRAAEAPPVASTVPHPLATTDATAGGDGAPGGDGAVHDARPAER